MEGTEVRQRGTRRTLMGKVTSDRMNKTVVVTVNRRALHPVYKKYVVRRSRFTAHDEGNECKAGDYVEIVESRPRSKNKRWKLRRVIRRAA